jgi:aryl-alcohol dehydrogenase-like predicted oxidoreductase
MSTAYGPADEEELLGRFLREAPRDSVVVATKFGFRIGSDGIRSVDGSPENVRRACDASLRRLGIETIDLFPRLNLHRPRVRGTRSS